MSGKLYIAKLRYKKTQVKYFGAQENISRSFQKYIRFYENGETPENFGKLPKHFYTRCIALLKIYKILRSMLNAFMLCIYNGCILCFYCEKLSKCIQTLIRIFGFFHSFSIFFHFSILNLLFRSSQRNFRNSIFLDFLCPNMSR